MKILISSLTLFFFCYLPTIKCFAEAKRIGLGVTLFGPTGLSAKYRLTKTKAIDGAFALSTHKDTQILLHSTYLKYNHAAIKTDAGAFGWYYGYGAKLRTYKSGIPEQQKIAFGPRAPIGLHLPFAKYSFDIFTELSLTLNLVPSTDLDFDFALGGRVFF